MNEYPTLEHSGEKLILADDNNRQCISISCIDEFPEYGTILDKKNLTTLKNTLGETLKGVALTPNRVFEVVFKPEIAKGLKDGSLHLMKTKNGEVLADAVHVATGQVAGKGRVVSNLPKQITSVGFQLVSFAVAQSHLADINESLFRIEEICKRIEQKIEIINIAKIKNDIESIKNMCADIGKNIELSDYKKNSIQKSIKDFGEYKISFEDEYNLFVKEINNMKDNDTFGTESVFNQLKQFLNRYEHFMYRIGLINQLYLCIRLLAGYIDPYGVNFSVATKFEKIENLKDSYVTAIENQVNKYLTSALWNSGETLALRKDSILLTLANQQYVFEKIEQQRTSALLLVERHLKKLQENRNIRYALKYDDKGEIIDACLA